MMKIHYRKTIRLGCNQYRPGWFFIVFFLWVSADLSAQTENFLTLENDNKIYDERIHTVLLHQTGKPLSDPVIRLGSGETLSLSFDDFSEQPYMFWYTFIHCAADWTTSDIQTSQYLFGFFNNEIKEFRYSRNVLTPYIHYDVVFPNQNTSFKVSGNYLLVVYADSPIKENLIFTRRFYVTESVASINAQIPFYGRNLSYTRKKQQLQFKVYAENLFLVEPHNTIKVVLKQNGRTDNMVFDLKPTHVYENEMEFDYWEENVFDGGNEFRNFDIKDFRYQSPNIRKITPDSMGYRVLLHTDQKRNFDEYKTIEDLDGRFLVQARSDQDTDTEAEYAFVDFSLAYPAPLALEDVFVVGQLSGWNLDEHSKMEYDYQKKAYHKRLFLKQGYYNYQYIIKGVGERKGDVTRIEGDHWNTTNQYTIMVYFRQPGLTYDRLVAFEQYQSQEIMVR